MSLTDKQAAEGISVLPEPVVDWNIAEDRRGEFDSARARLVAALDFGGRERRPALAARAQARFGCWLEQEEEGWQTSHIAACRHGFWTALWTLEDGIGADVAMEAPAYSARAVPAVLSGEDGFGPPEQSAFTVFFAFDSSDLSPEALATLDDIAAAAKTGLTFAVVVDGHADRAGPDGYNIGLSARRAAVVEAALIERGVSARRMAVHAFGELRPRVHTPDDLREPRNRRVEIVIGPESTL